jgi:hypothetical protein
MKHPDPVAFLKQNKMTVTILSDEERAAFKKFTKTTPSKYLSSSE